MSPQAGNLSQFPAGRKAHAKVYEAIECLPRDPGAVFEADVFELILNLARNDAAESARIRSAIKASGQVSMSDFDRRVSNGSVRNKAGSGERELTLPELWPSSVEGAELLDDIAAALRLHVIADEVTIHAATLWIAFTWFIDVVDVAPIANITAPEKRCGKTVLLSLLTKLSRRALPVSNIAPAAMFRALDQWGPTLLIDEADSFLASYEGARGILNSGFDRESSFVVRCVGDDHQPVPFNVWGAKAICGIGKIADTLADRSIPLRLRRKLSTEQVTKVRHGDPATFQRLASQLARFAEDNKESIRHSRPAEVEGLNDRANDCWEPLLAIAEVAGDPWLRRAQASARELHVLDENAPSIGVELLASIKVAFEHKGHDRLSTAELLKALAADEYKPWATWNSGAPLNSHQLSRRLSEYGIKPETVRIGSNTPKGYKLHRFEEAFKRYLPQPGDG